MKRRPDRVWLFPLLIAIFILVHAFELKRELGQKQPQPPTEVHIR